MPVNVQHNLISFLLVNQNVSFPSELLESAINMKFSLSGGETSFHWMMCQNVLFLRLYTFKLFLLISLEISIKTVMKQFVQILIKNYKHNKNGQVDNSYICRWKTKKMCFEPEKQQGTCETDIMCDVLFCPQFFLCDNPHPARTHSSVPS